MLPHAPPPSEHPTHDDDRRRRVCAEAQQRCHATQRFTVPVREVYFLLVNDADATPAAAWLLSLPPQCRETYATAQH